MVVSLRGFRLDRKTKHRPRRRPGFREINKNQQSHARAESQRLPRIIKITSTCGRNLMFLQLPSTEGHVQALVGTHTRNSDDTQPPCGKRRIVHGAGVRAEQTSRQDHLSITSALQTMTSKQRKAGRPAAQRENTCKQNRTCAADPKTRSAGGTRTGLAPATLHRRYTLPGDNSAVTTGPF
jgi:hypothetical protein